MSASGSKEAGISPATTPGSQSDMVTVSIEPSVRTLKLSSESIPATSPEAGGSSSGSLWADITSGRARASMRQSSAAAVMVLILCLLCC